MEYLTAIMLAFAGLVAATFTGLLREEVSAWLPKLTSQLIKLAVWRAPSASREQYAQEWAADVSEYPGKLSQLLRATGCVFAAGGLRPWTTARVFFYLDAVGVLFGSTVCILSLVLFARDANNFLPALAWGLNAVSIYVTVVHSFAGAVRYLRTSRG
ncbi:hypothetical protein [Methylobacterium gnaphalii]|uniref:Uncharacterized protein n=1 Tax=Methylobacterium gnaphalii TaxID=1010610 RepID=A0A512JIP4_9HYPH|nr:hypothetical protein [Methylobacterium gnaphalii]GEP09838.1 hypothetical protein MGN01_16830 [Methylobacterium gnaphalii]GJD67247.1 hypothetical protein MMMDOFMJ_0161 [Methylobacterium gnaphalii]GLS49867.1 hypothetical protein GCM10007885_27190 [Methylobacterium gnaphalii]